MLLGPEVNVLERRAEWTGPRRLLLSGTRELADNIIDPQERLIPKTWKSLAGTALVEGLRWGRVRLGWTGWDFGQFGWTFVAFGTWVGLAGRVGWTCLGRCLGG